MLEKQVWFKSNRFRWGLVHSVVPPPHTGRHGALCIRTHKDSQMSRKHFIAIAAAIRSNFDDRNLREQVAGAFLQTLKDCNPNFNASRFLEAAIGK